MVSATRNHAGLSETARPAIIVLDADEAAEEEERAGRPAHAPQLVVIQGFHRMNGRLKARLERQKGVFLRTFVGLEEPIAEAATAAVTEVGDRIRAEARANIAATGFSCKWRNALRVDRYPRGREVSITPAAHLYHRMQYAWVHEEGAAIRASCCSGFRSATRPRDRSFRVTPRRYPGPLQFARRPEKPPLLVAKLGLSRAKAKALQLGEVSLATGKKGAVGGGNNRVVRAVPMFVGISTVRFGKRLNITGVIRREAARLAELYLGHLKAND